MRIFFLIFILLFTVNAHATDAEIVDFDKSMGINFFKKIYNNTIGTTQYKILKKIKNNYNDNINKEPTELNQIPRIIHHIWLEDAPLPSNTKYFINSCRKSNPNYEFKIWTLEDLNSLPPLEKNLVALGKTTQEKTELLSYEILYKYGGIYLSNNIECLGSFDRLISRYTNFTGIASESYNFKFTGSILGSSINNRLLKKTIDDILESKIKSKKLNQQRFTEILYNNLLESLPNSSNIMILPASYFYPTYKGNMILEPIEDKYIVPTPSKETLTIEYFHGKSLVDYRKFNYELVGENLAKKFIYSPYYGKDRANQIFDKLYNNNFPSLIDFSENNRIPLEFNILCYDNCDKFWRDNLNWFTINNNFSFHLWSSTDIQNISTTNLALLSKADGEQAKHLLITLLILEHNGGIYVNHKFTPINKFDEITNKYDFFGAIPELGSISEEILIHPDIIGTTPNNIIIRQALLELAKTDKISVRKIMQALTNSTIDNYKKAGRIIILPGTYFYGNPKSNTNFKFTNYN